MNIFYLDKNVKTCAQYHVDKHVVKMILEYAQLLSTAHRVLDGELFIENTGKRNMKRWSLDDEVMNTNLYTATHVNHPSAIWVRHSAQNYNWLYCLLAELLKEYTHRYDKFHACEKLNPFLRNIPRSIDVASVFTEPTACMPDKYKVPGNSLQSYYNYYNQAKTKLFSWSRREVPPFINNLGF
jgi:hypothetical protein